MVAGDPSNENTIPWRSFRPHVGLATFIPVTNDEREIASRGSFPFPCFDRFPMYRHAKRVVITVLGASVLLVGVAMIVLPGPAILVIPAGLGILATEFVWARRLLNRIKQQLPGARAEPAASNPPNVIVQPAEQRVDPTSV